MNDVDIDLNPEYTMHKKIKDNLYLSDEEIDILKSYNIDYNTCSNLKDLINILMEYIDETDDIILENLLDVLSERDYYENFNK